MKLGLFIQANAKQMLGAKIAKHALETRGKAKARGIPVTILEVETMPLFKNFAGTTYARRGRTVAHDTEDLQSFTLTRFLPPELMQYEGRAVVIDPDIFAIADIGPLFELELHGHTLAACPKKSFWDSSVMLLDNAKLRAWNVAVFLKELGAGTKSYDEIMDLTHESVEPLSRDWNSLDAITSTTKILHTTRRITQPWKTGLPIDFTRNPLQKFLGIIPREPLLRMLGRYPTHYLPHPNARIENLFFTLARETLADGVITKEEIAREIEQKHIRSDALVHIAP